ncbi:MAG: hypothetical protein R2751_01135 [Bacteroidales bacterium]
MRRTPKPTVPILWILPALLFCGVLRAQVPSDSVLLRDPAFRERFHLCTDRSLYGTGEAVRFRAFHAIPGPLKEIGWSRVLYLEMIDEGGWPVARGKFPLDETGAEGSLPLPDSLASGLYVLRAYTHWMRNFPAGEFAQVPLEVVQPRDLSFREEASATGDGFFSDQGSARSDASPFDDAARASPFRILSPPTPVERGEKIRIRLVPAPGLHFPDGVCVSVFRQGTQTQGESSVSRDASTGLWAKTASQVVTHFPETRGVSLTATVRKKADGSPVPFAGLGLVLLGDSPQYVSHVADENGRIRFALPTHRGASDLLLVFEGEDAGDWILDADPEYDPRPPLREATAETTFRHDPRIRESFQTHWEIASAFRDPVVPQSPSGGERRGPPFYGEADHRYVPADYVDLPDLEEFLFELVPQVQVRTIEGKRRLLLLDDGGGFLEYLPLVLLDEVPVSDPEDLLSLSPALFARIDVVNREYIRGSHLYGGIVSFRSVRGDRAGLGLPDRSVFLTYQTYSVAHESPGTKAEPGDRLPDLRHTLSWEPDLDPGVPGGAVLEFDSNDLPGVYGILVRGTDGSGRLHVGISEFVIGRD